jgi:spermidine synthase
VDESDLDVVAYEPSPIGMICLRRRGVPSRPGALVTEITLDHQFLMSSESTASERALATRALAWHGGAALRVLVGGLGLGYTAREALAFARVAAVEVIELLPPVVDWLDRGLIPLAAELHADPRFSVRLGDVYAELAASPRRRHDLILIDVDHSPEERLGPSNAAFYTAEGLARAKQHLAPDGVLAVWSYAASSPFADALRAAFPEVRVESVHVENPVIEATETNWLFLARNAG